MLRSTSVLALTLLVAACGSAAPSASPSALATAPAGPPPTPGQVRTDARGVEQVWVPAGSFLMGTDAAAIERLTAMDPPAFVLGEFASEQPQHRVRLTRGYWIDRFEVTNAQFRQFVDAGGYVQKGLWSEAGWAWLQEQASVPPSSYCLGDAPDMPARCVTWYEAEAYASFRHGRLPTEAEWEFAARGPESLVYPWGSEWDASRCNVVDSAGPKPVGSYPKGASWIGAQDMAGNAMEWVSDWLAVDYYAASPGDDPAGPSTGEKKVEKGGWWGGNQFVARAAYRHFEDPPTYADPHIGFRVVSLE